VTAGALIVTVVCDALFVTSDVEGRFIIHYELLNRWNILLPEPIPPHEIFADFAFRQDSLLDSIVRRSQPFLWYKDFTI
jgi:hypothetical protein